MSHIWHFLNLFVFLYPLYMSFVWTIGGLLFHFRYEFKPCPDLDSYPLFSILVPARNEEKHIEDTLVNLQDLDYPEYEVIAINDGSTDGTGLILDRLVRKYPKWLRVIHSSPNNGKANSLNIGCLLSKGELILTIDADCLLAKDALKKMAWHLVKFPRVGAVTGNPRILNRTSLLAKIQIGEYSSIIGLIKRSQRILGKILTVSGVVAAFKKSALCDCGFFDADTVTEDIDVTWKLQKRFWDIRFEPRALSWILAPETTRGLWHQRIRWAQGGIEVIKKHCDVWSDWKQRRFWSIYIEYVATMAWSFTFATLIISWIGAFLLYYFGILDLKPTRPFLPPEWTGSVLAFVCLIQFIASFYIDRRYEGKAFFKYYFWVVWYPFFYWLINGVAVFVGVFNVFVRKGGVSVRWQSPDRGSHTLDS